jgi:polyphosphate kinase 2 (PPK2 family)
MNIKKIVKSAHDLSKQYRVDNGKKFQMKDVDPGDTGDLKSADKPRAMEALQTGIGALAELQDKLYAQDRWSLLLVFQAMDAAGKDGTIKHVMSGINPQGCQVSSFKSPSPEDLDHDYLWRCVKELPQRGRIGIFNRSYYEETLVVRVHPEFLAGQKLPAECVTKHIWPAFPRAAGEPRQELEILRQRCQGTRLLEGLHARLRRDHPGDVDGGRPLVCRSRGQ